MKKSYKNCKHYAHDIAQNFCRKDLVEGVLVSWSLNIKNDCGIKCKKWRLRKNEKI